ncbi:hypothetical protein EVA_14152 [gut metagenome]|uniref:Uncharacterized protein n=1 Tax=gut metagenome TaxID=749906 RepID=J9FS19_9ZZZZ
MRRVDRFDEYMKTKGLNDNQVTKQIGLSIGTLGKSRKEGRDLSDKVIEKILNFYIDLDKVWLLTGEGEMLKSSNHTIINSPIGDNSTQIAGSNVTENTSLNKALDELSEMRKLLAEAIRNNKEQADRFFSIIEKIQTP